MTYQLRSFFYLDEEAVDDFLAQLEGGLTVGSYEEREVTATEDSVEHLTNSLEVQRTRRDTPQVKVARLYDLLEQGKHIQTLDHLDQSVYDAVMVRNIVEVSGTARLPRWEELKNDVESASSWVRILEAAGQNPLDDPTVRLGFEVFPLLASMNERDDTMLILSPVDNPKYHVAGRIKTKYMRRPKEEFATELTILGKVQRKLAKGQDIDVAGLWPKLATLQGQSRGQNRAQRRQASKQAAEKGESVNPFEQAIKEVIKYPALEVLPIAVYQ